MSERNNLIEQISNLNKKLIELDLKESNKLLLVEEKVDLLKFHRLKPKNKSNNNNNNNNKNKKRILSIGALPPSLALAPKRHIALLFTYEGWAHSGLAYQPPSAANNSTPLPTVEGCLLAALEQARLIEPMISGDGFGCGFERCGRTDAGVSSSAQVVNLWVRSDLENPMGDVTSNDESQIAKDVQEQEVGEENKTIEEILVDERKINSKRKNSSAGKAKSPSLTEIPYVTVLNRKLPPSIRILAWSPVSPEFSSRYSCIWRHYKYFFSSSPSIPFARPKFNFGSAFTSLKPEESEEWQERFNSIDWNGITLDIDLMKDGLQRLVGDHDYRNFCKIDAAKQLNSHQRRVISASIDTLEEEGSDMFVLNLRGGAFLYNQVRHIVALLFLIGAKHESPDIIDRLLWTSDRTTMTETMSSITSNPELETVDRKPSYEMADDLPLILWQCGYNSSELNWRLDNTTLISDNPTSPTVKKQITSNIGSTETFRRQFLEMNERWTKCRLKSIILRHHLSSFSALTPVDPSIFSVGGSQDSSPKEKRLTITPHGAGRHSTVLNYVPLLQRPRGELPEIINQKWAEGRGAQRMKKRAEDKERSDSSRSINLEKKAKAKKLELEEQATSAS